MPLTKLNIKPGVNREKPRYSSEGVWYECNNVRFRQGLPEKIGGWVRSSNQTYLGLCRSLGTWSQLSGGILRGVGTSLKFYVEQGSQFRDATPLRLTNTLGTDPFAATSGSSVVSVTDASLGDAVTGDFVTFSGATAVGGLDLNGEYQISVVDSTTYQIDAGSNASSTASGGGAATEAAYQINIGNDLAQPIGGWGSGPFGFGPWGEGISSSVELRIWNQAPFGQDLLYGPAGGPVYYWSLTNGIDSRGALLADLPGAENTPIIHDLLLVSDISRFAFVFGTNVIGSSTYDPMLIRWSAQENIADWTPKATNQAGSLRLSRGSKIVAVQQSRQEVLVWTTNALYSLQFLGGGDGWGAQLVGENLTLISSRATAYANGVAFWMGNGKFYTYDGTVKPLRCDVRKFLFNRLNDQQAAQIFAGSNEEFHEIWWFYPSSGSTTVDSYVIYNYREDIWTYGDMERTAWVDNSSTGKPIAATYENNIVVHEIGVDDEASPTKRAIPAFIQSAEFDIADGDRFMFVRRVIPEITFAGSDAIRPCAMLSLLPLRNPGSGYKTVPSEGLVNIRTIERTSTVPIENFTEQLNIRVRGRHMVIRVESDTIGTTWQLGSTRLDMRADGKK